MLERKEVPLPEYIPAATRKYAEDKGVKLYDIKIACAGGMPVSGYLAMPGKPEKGKSCATVTFMGAPGHMALVWVPLSTASYGGIGLSVNAHGHENGRDEKYINEFRGHMGPWFGDTPDKVYVRGIALRALRAVQFLKSLPEWNGKNLEVGGGSMGGGQAMLAAALDPDVSFCDASVPTFCDWAGGLKQQRSGWPEALTKPEQVNAAAYYDLANLAPLIKAPTIMRTGFIDPLCASTGHYAIYNRMTCPKLLFHHPGGGHEGMLLNPKEGNQQIAAFKKEQQQMLDVRKAK